MSLSETPPVEPGAAKVEGPAGQVPEDADLADAEDKDYVDRVLSELEDPRLVVS